MTAPAGGEPSAGDAGPPGGPVPPSQGARRQAPDPLGKRALFWAPGPQAPGTARPLGRTALYSRARGGPWEEPGPLFDPVRTRGPVTVSCSSCGATSRIGLLDFLLFQLPVGFWLPRGRFGHRMTCPACRHRAWVGVTLRRD